MSTASRVERLVEPFSSYEVLQAQIRHVLNSLPNEVLDDFLSDEHFCIALDDYAPGKGRTVFLPELSVNGEESRCVVLKPKLNRCSEPFSQYVIAHEFAHAFLRNGGWGEISDREVAADALATHWGFPPRPWER